jgi:co-chaperonin GroES (HSP10)
MPHVDHVTLTIEDAIPLLACADRLKLIDVLCEGLFKENKMFTPLFPWVFVLVCKKAQKVGHIFLPEKQNKVAHEGIVLATWNQKLMERGTITKEGVRMTRCEVLHSEMQLGDRVLFHHWAGKPVPGYDTDRFRVVRETHWSDTKDGGIFAKINIEDASTQPLEQLIGMVQEAMPEEGLAYYDSKMAALLKAKVDDRFVVVDRESGSVTLSGV